MNYDTNKDPWIILIGCMGSGKSSVGKMLSKTLDCPFIDLDDEICQTHHKTIQEIFDLEGEDAFREMESNALHNILFQKNGVLAAGGGTPCFLDNMLFMKESGKTIYLEASPEVLTKRIVADKSNVRPLLENLSSLEIEQSINKLLEKRNPYYQQADLIVDASASVEQVVDFIKGEL